MTSIKFNVGDKVILGKHEHKCLPPYTFIGAANWDYDMEEFVGKGTTITRIHNSVDSSGFQTYNVDIDGGMWSWRGDNMTPFLEPNFEEPVVWIKSPEGATCKVCQEYNSYVNSNANFICYRCQH